MLVRVIRWRWLVRRRLRRSAVSATVNREPVGLDCDGLDLLRQVKSDYPSCTVMLVSDRPDAQREAVRHGAVAGFGKSQIGSPALAERVGEHLHSVATSRTPIHRHSIWIGVMVSVADEGRSCTAACVAVNTISRDGRAGMTCC
jgi:hypothetical protein